MSSSKHWVRFSSNVNLHSSTETSGDVPVFTSRELPLLKFTCSSCLFLSQLLVVGCWVVFFFLFVCFFLTILNYFHLKVLLLRVRPVALACKKRHCACRHLPSFPYISASSHCFSIILGLSLSWTETTSHFTTWWQVFMLVNSLFPFVSGHIVV